MVKNIKLFSVNDAAIAKITNSKKILHSNKTTEAIAINEYQTRNVFQNTNLEIVPREKAKMSVKVILSSLKAIDCQRRKKMPKILTRNKITMQLGFNIVSKVIKLTKNSLPLAGVT